MSIRPVFVLDNLVDSSDNVETNVHFEVTLDELLDDVQNVFKSTQQREELKIHLIEDVFPSLLLFSSKYNFKNSSSFQTLMEEVKWKFVLFLASHRFNAIHFVI